MCAVTNTPADAQTNETMQRMTARTRTDADNVATPGRIAPTRNATSAKCDNRGRRVGLRSRLIAAAQRAAVVVSLAAFLGPAPALASSDVRPIPGRPWFGPNLDWTSDQPAHYTERLGQAPSLFAQRVRYPLAENDVRHLERFAELTATYGSIAVLTLEPHVALTELSTKHAKELAAELAALHERYESHFLIRFAPEMNGSWVIWGQQPDRYVDAFRTVAKVVSKAGAAGRAAYAEMVWSPAYGAGYPFDRAYGRVEGAGNRVAASLDSNDDGTVNDRDDSYTPYYPGARYVDWVGLSLYRYGRKQQFGDNALPAPGELEARLDERFGYGTNQPRRSFYDRFATSDRPMLLETSALWNTANDRGSEINLKRAWWRQVFTATGKRPFIGAISWLELVRPEAEINDQIADWRATHTSALARTLSRDLSKSGIRLGPVTKVIKVDSSANATDDTHDADTTLGTSTPSHGSTAGSAGNTALTLLAAGATMLAVTHVVRRRP